MTTIRALVSPASKNALQIPLARSTARAPWRTSVVGALVLHACFLLYAAFLQAPLLSRLAFLEGAADGELLVTLERDQTDTNAPGGGSTERDLGEVASGEAPVEPLVPSSIDSESQKATPPSSRPDFEATPTPGVDVPSPDYATTDLLTAVDSAWLTRTELLPGPKRVNRIENPEPVLARMGGAAKVYARHYGQGRGSYGGPAGQGRGWGRNGANVVSSHTPFGGDSGQFAGRVCFIPENTRHLKELGACQTRATLYTDTFDTPRRSFNQGFPGLSERTEWFSIVFRGSFSVSRPGAYAFRLVSDDGSLLQIDGLRLIDNDGIHSAVGVVGKVDLDAGGHSLELLYFQGPRNEVALQLFVTPPGKPEQLFRAEL